LVTEIVAAVSGAPEASRTRPVIDARNSCASAHGIPAMVMLNAIAASHIS
jgi:hypothetical protein